MEELKYKIAFETDQVKAGDLVDPSVLSTLVELNNQIEEYKLDLKELKVLEEIQNGLTQEQAEQQQKLKLELKQVQDTYTKISREIQHNTKAANQNKNSYQGLVEENKRLMDAMRNLPLDDTTGKLQELQAQYNANNDVLKDFDATIGNHQRNVGNYAGSLRVVKEGFGKLPGPIGNVGRMIGDLGEASIVFGESFKELPGAFNAAKTATTGFIGSLSAMKKALIATGIGALVVAAGMLVAYWEDIKALVNGVSREQEKILETTKKNVDAAREKSELLELQENTLRLQGKSEREILVLKQKYTDDEIAALQITILKQKEIQKIQEQTAKRNRDILRGIFQFVNAPITLLLTSIDLVGKALGKNFGLESKLSKTVAQLAFDPEEIKQKGDETNKELQKQLNQLISNRQGYQLDINAIDKEEDENAKRRAEEAKKRGADLLKEQQKRADEIRKIFEQLQKVRDDIDIAFFDELQEMRNKEVDILISLEPKLDLTDFTEGTLLVGQLYNDALKEQTLLRLEQEGKLVESAELQKQFRIQELTQMFIDAGVDANQAGLDAQKQANLEYADKFKKAKEGELALAKQVEEAKVAIAQGSVSSILSIGESLFGKTKAIAVAQAIIDTWASANSAAKNTPGGVLAKSLAAAAMVAKGFANVKKILSTKVGSASTGGATGAPATSALNGGTLSPAGIVLPQRFSGQSPFATGMASSVGDPAMNRGEINIQANVDRRGLAIAVREGERSIRTQQFDYR